MKIKALILGFITLIVITGLASAEVRETNNGFYGIINDDGSYTKTQTLINDFNAIGFVCENDDCGNVAGTLWNGEIQNSGNDNQMILKYPTELQEAGYGVFFYKEGYFPFEAKITYFGNGHAPVADNYLTRKQNCQVPINDLIISHYGNKVVVNVTLSSSVSSPVLNAGPLNYIPDSIKYLYAVNVNVSFRFVGPQNVVLVENTNIPASESKRVSVSVDNLKAGQYQLIVESNTNDVKCVNSIPLKAYSNLLIEDNRTNATLPTVSILSPEVKTYKNKTILVNIRTTNATSVLYNWNGANVSYTAPVYVTFNEGVNTLTAYAVNEVTATRTSVTFNVDTTPPEKVNNLRDTFVTNDTIKWEWTNPSDADFAYNMIYITGVNVLNSSAQSFIATGLLQNTTYTITVRTVDSNGNINQNGVSDQARTLMDSFPPQEEGKIDITIFSPIDTTYEQASVLIYIYAENASEIKFSLGEIINETYTAPVYVPIANGDYMIYVYASNSKYSAEKRVTFKINVSIEDTAPPGSVSGLTLTGRTDNSLTWEWTNPSDADFAYSIIYLDGVNVLNTSSNTYKARNLNDNTFYTISIKTVDLSGNVNVNEVSNNARTLKNEVEDQDEDNGGEGTDLYDYPVESDKKRSSALSLEWLNASEKKDIALNNIKKVQPLNVLAILIIASCILLLLILVVLAYKKR